MEDLDLRKYLIQTFLNPVSILKSMPFLQNSRNYTEGAMEQQTELDAVIVGAGACGSLVARELSTAGLSVLVPRRWPSL